jgi:periplasmic copper chaperone A
MRSISFRPTAPRRATARRTVGRVAIATATTATVGVLLLAGTASAHIDPTPAAIEAGAAVTVGFGVEHGCDGSPTIQVQIQIPDGVSDAQPVDQEGWTASTSDGADGQVVTFADGLLDPDTPADFTIAFTAPTTAGTINFPIVQTCEVGQLDWIEIAVEGQEEPEHPAPAVLVTSAPATSDEVAPEPGTGEEAVVDEETDEELEAAPSVPATTPDTAADTVPADSIVTTVTATVDSAADAPVAADAEGDDSNTGLIIAAIVLGVAVILGAGYLLKRRSSNEDPTTGSPTGTTPPAAS